MTGQNRDVRTKRTFDADTRQKAWERQKGRCAYCGKRLIRSNHDTGSSGAWHAHHRKPVSHGGLHHLGNCALLCINLPEDCHHRIGHKGKTKNRVKLCDYELPYLYGGDPFTPLDIIKTPLDEVKVPLKTVKTVL